MTHFSFSELNLLGDSLAAIINMTIGCCLVLQSIFGKQWMAYLGFKEKDLNASPGPICAGFLSGSYHCPGNGHVFEGCFRCPGRTSFMELA